MLFSLIGAGNVSADYEKVVYKTKLDCANNAACSAKMASISKLVIIVNSNKPSIVKGTDKAIDKSKFGLQWGVADISDETPVTLTFVDPDSNETLGKWTFFVTPANLCKEYQEVTFGQKLKNCDTLIPAGESYYIISDADKDFNKDIKNTIIKSPKSGSTKVGQFDLEWGDQEPSKKTPVTLYLYDDAAHKILKKDVSFYVVPKTKNNTEGQLSIMPSQKTLASGESATFTIVGGSGAYTVVSEDPSVIANPDVKDNTFTIKPNLVAAGKDIKLHVRESTSTGTPEDVKITVTSPSDPGYDTSHFYFTVGTVILNGQKLTQQKDASTGKVTLTAPASDSSIDVRPSFEAGLRDRAAWRKSEDKNRWLDYEFHLGFSAGGGSNSSALTSVTAGGGDFFGEVNVGAHLLKKDPCKSEGNLCYTLNADALYGFVTDKSFQQIHSYGGAGLALVTGYKWSSRTMEFLTGVYGGFVDLPSFTLNKDTQQREVVLQNDGRPKFLMRGAVMVRQDIHIPVGNTGYITIDGRYFPQVFKKDALQPWSVRLGVTYPIDNLVTSLMKQ